MEEVENETKRAGEIYPCAYLLRGLGSVLCSSLDCFGPSTTRYGKKRARLLYYKKYYNNSSSVTAPARPCSVVISRSGITHGYFHQVVLVTEIRSIR